MSKPDEKQQKLDEMIAKWQAEQDASLNTFTSMMAQYKINPHPQLKQSSVLNGIASVFSALGGQTETRRAVEEMLEAARKCLFIVSYPARPDAAHWKPLHHELQVMANWNARVKAAGSVSPEERRNYHERKDYVMHMLNAFAAGDRFIVAKLAYGGE